MLLFHRDFGGAGRPIVILHGLFGSSRNWTTIGKELSSVGHVFALDARNHGESPHHPSHTLADMREDLAYWITSQNLEDVILLGHSMGGITAASYALRDRSRIRGLIVVDIAPRKYPPRHDAEFRALKVDVSSLATRAAVDKEMARFHPDPMVRQFLQMNLERIETGYRWKINVAALEAAHFLDGGDFDGKSTLPALFITGGGSDFVLPEDHDLILSLFPRSRIVTIPGADHYLHYTAQGPFLAEVAAWIQSLPQEQ